MPRPAAEREKLSSRELETELDAEDVTQFVDQLRRLGLLEGWGEGR